MIDDFSPGLPEICSVQASVRIQDLAVPDTDRIPLHFRRIDLYDACKILTKVQNSLIAEFCCFQNRHLFPAPYHDLCRHEMIRQRPAVGNRQKYRLAFRMRSAFRKEDLSVVQAGIIIRACYGAYRSVVRIKTVPAPVRQLDLKHPRHSRLLAVDLCFIITGESAAIPSLSQIDPEDITAAQQPGDIVSLVKQVMIIIRIARRQHLVSDLLTINLRFIHSQRRDGQYGFFDGSIRDVLFEYFYRSFFIRAFCCDKMSFQFHLHFLVIFYCSSFLRASFLSWIRFCTWTIAALSRWQKRMAAIVQIHPRIGIP